MNKQIKLLTISATWLFICLLILSGCKEPSKYESVNLLALTVMGQEITPSFNNNTSDYSLTVDASVTSINIIIAASKGSTVTINNREFSNSGEFDLSDGINTFNIQVITLNESRGYNLIVKQIKQNSRH